MITKTDLIWNFQTINARVKMETTVGIRGIRQTIGTAPTGKGEQNEHQKRRLA
jgi:hypothetical protein